MSWGVSERGAPISPQCCFPPSVPPLSPSNQHAQRRPGTGGCATGWCCLPVPPLLHVHSHPSPLPSSSCPPGCSSPCSQHRQCPGAPVCCSPHIHPLPPAAQNAGHAPAQGERDPHPGDLLPVPHPPLPVHVRGLRPPGGDPGVPGAVPDPPALQHRQRLAHRPAALLVPPHLPQGRPALRRLCRPPEPITELIGARAGTGTPRPFPRRAAAPRGWKRQPGMGSLSCLARCSCPPTGVEARHSFPLGFGSAAPPNPGLHERGLFQPPGASAGADTGADTGHRLGDAAAGMGSLCRTCHSPSRAWSSSTALQSCS